MPMKKLTKCPILPECTKTRIWQDSDGTLYDLNMADHDLAPHSCKVMNKSECPKVFYMAAWDNTRTQRTRWLGPERSRHSVTKPPADSVTRKTGRGSKDTSEWVLKELLMVENPQWIKLEITDEDRENK